MNLPNGYWTPGEKEDATGAGQDKGTMEKNER